MPSSKLWEKVAQWGEAYGDIVYVEIIGRPMLFLNSYEDALELLANRSAIYSSRPHRTMAMDLEGWDWLTVNVPYGDTFRKHRAFQHRLVNNPETVGYLDVQLRETHQMLNEVLNRLVSSRPGYLAEGGRVGGGKDIQDGWSNFIRSPRRSLRLVQPQTFLVKRALREGPSRVLQRRVLRVASFLSSSFLARLIHVHHSLKEAIRAL
ncbi:hypothetical protein SCHPADRAFT_832003 [Schizopora paradoxa]|uniref:Cytochrome P450 n=1 Tax=Schizopora paradoxa TaxID=27342 RepID=A0A0H2RFZ4_9AGAM|nr:hypothetical protein SCHPADRAFT_832003 [Schizopora paradoxa]